MRLLERTSLKRKQIWVIMLNTTVALLLACTAFAAFELLPFRKTMVRDLTVLARVVGDSSTASGAIDPALARKNLAELEDEPDVLAACVYDQAGNMVVEYHRPGVKAIEAPPKSPKPGISYSFNGGKLVLFEPIVDQGGTIGTVYIASDMQALYARLTRYVTISAGVFMVTLLIAFLLAGRLQRLISEPILRLVDTTRMVARDKDYSVRVARRSHDEIGVLIDGFNEMLSQIQEREAVLQRTQGELEQRVRERTQELASSLSLIHATLESTTDGILVADGVGKGVNWNEKFLQMWGISSEALKSGNEKALLEAARTRLKDTGPFLSTIEELYGHPEKESFDLLEFKDGRTIERYSIPQRIGAKCVGRVWSFRDITERRRAENELRWKTALLEAQLESSYDGMLVMDNAQRKIFQNRRLVELWKIPKEIAEDPDHEKQIQFAASVTENPEKALETIRRVHADPEAIVQDELDLRDGTILDRYSYPIIAKDGTRYGRIWSFRDVTERKRAEAELARERDFLGTLLENSPDYIYFKDRESRFLRCSQSLANRYELDRSALVGKTDFDIFTEEHARPAFEDEQRIMRSGEPIIGKIEKEFWKQGEVSWVLTSKMPLRNDAGEITGTFGISKDITAIKEAEAKLDQAHRQLLETSRMAGMAEVATSVLHNVGNVLNSVNVSCAVVSDRVRRSKVTGLSKAAALLREHDRDLAVFLADDPKGKQLPGYLHNLAEHLAKEQEEIVSELTLLNANVDHIKEIVAMQQTYSKVSGVRECLAPVDLMEDALRMTGTSLERHQIKLVKAYSPSPQVLVERHKVLQILVNLLRNAKHACDDSGRPDKLVALRISPGDDHEVRIVVTDNGTGIAAANLTRIFEHGFTTRKDGHGFGLHSGALAAKELGGSLTVASDGPGKGATFTLTLPRLPVEDRA